MIVNILFHVVIYSILIKYMDKMDSSQWMFSQENLDLKNCEKF